MSTVLKPARTVPLFVPSIPPPERYREALEAVARSGMYTNFGPLLLRFEATLADRLGVKAERMTAVTNATAGLTAALLALAGRTGELCAMPAWTHAATPAAARLAGLTPCFLDVDWLSWQLVPDGLERRLAAMPAKVAAVVVVSPFGARIDVEGWAAFQERTGIPVVVDAAAGFDSWSDTPLTTVVSFHATKGFAIGEGGAVLAPDPDVGRRVRKIVNLGMEAGRVALMPGLNAKLDEIRAAIGLAALEAWPQTRAVLAGHAAAYDAALAIAGVRATRPDRLDGVVNSTYPLALDDGDASRTVEELAHLGVHARRWWGDGCHRAPAFADCPREALPVSDDLARRVLGLPLHTALSFEDVEYVAHCLAEVAGSTRIADR